MEYTVYTAGGEIFAAEAASGDVLPAIPWAARVRMVTGDQDEAAAEVGRLVLAGYRWEGNGWLEQASFRCDKCARPAEPDGKGGFRHADEADAVACRLISGGGMLDALLEDE